MTLSIDAPQPQHLRSPRRDADTLLDLFSPVHDHAPVRVEAGIVERRAIFAADALHRANNLSQMASALGSTRVRHLHGQATDPVAQARALARAYAELGAPEIAGSIVPCKPLLDEIATRLVALFSGDRAIRLMLSLDDVVLSAERRRGLILIASELLINALKYAFPSAGSGTIFVDLARSDDTLTLLVADDGVGIPSDAPAGSGSALLDKLTGLIGADIRRESSANGLSVVVSLAC